MMDYEVLVALGMQDGLFRARWFEPMLAVISFGVFINLYWYHERIRGLSSDKKFMQTVSFGWGPVFNSAIAYSIGIGLWTSIVPVPGPIPDGVPGDLSEAMYMVAELVSGIVLYDAIFFFIHWSLHEIPGLRSIHRRHHDRSDGNVEARDTLRHSILDGSLQVLVNILVQRNTPWGAVKSRLARGLHNILVTWMLSESHSAAPYPYIWRRWFVGVREHRLHHLDATHREHGQFHRYQQFFGYLDDLRAYWLKRRWAVRMEVQQKNV